MRNKLKKGDREEFIIDLTHRQGEIERRKERFALLYQDIWDAGIEIVDDNDMQRE